ncbi:MAG: hypothetical protein JWO20_2537 [Candidatus Angelobacter sp.]|nr:hypothetical protein [Candidatus Angelobacter sp.]
MISLERCRKLLSNGNRFTDDELIALRDRLVSLADIALHHSQKENVESRREGVLHVIPEPDRYEAEERAAILQYEGGITREEAERRAILEWTHVSEKGKARIQ